MWPGSLVSEVHFLFPKARDPTTPRFIYATQGSDGRRVSEWVAEHDHLIRAPYTILIQYDHMTQNLGHKAYSLYHNDAQIGSIV